MTTRTINVKYLARVEGEGALHVKLAGDRVKDVKLEIFEPPRFFEALLRGRDFREAPDITARICGICPIAYQMSAVHAMESICGVTIDPQVRLLRRLIYCGEWIESHVLHIFMLHLPDFLGYPDAIRMAKDHPETVQRALRMKKTGNRIVSLMAGREIHPINVRVGGFYKVPTRRDLSALRDDLEWGLTAAIETVRFVSQLRFPEFEQDYEFVGLRHPDEYPLNEGRLASNKGMDCPISQYDSNLIEEHVPHSTALQTTVNGRGSAHLGPLARFNLNFDRLTPDAMKAARDAGLDGTCLNPFKSIIVRSVEVVFAFEEALRIIETYERPVRPSVEARPRPGTGYGCTEAPRGICYHRYAINDAGTITDAKIVPPTAVNQKSIEQDLRRFIGQNLGLPEERLTWECEQAIRNYDPCISCSTHFLKLHIDRG